MIINKKSWHYKYISCGGSLFDLDEPNNLCQYIRQFIGATIVFAFILGVIEAVGLAVAITIFPQSLMLALSIGLPLGAFTLFLGFSLVFGTVWLLFDKIPKMYRNRKNSTNAKEKQSGPFVQYIKDKHNKMCSTIEYEND